MKLIVLSALVACVVGMTQPRANFEAEWNEWKILHRKSYIVEEEYKRQMIWEQNRQLVLKHNYEYDLGQHTYTLGMNRFADMTNEEFKGLILSERPSTIQATECIAGNYTPKANPQEMDWRKRDYVTPVKNQLQCGSCWAFSTTGSVEGQLAKIGQLVSLSEQNLVDCSDPEGDEGCGGGLMDFAFDYIIDNGGIDSEASYPYVGVQQDCKFTAKNIAATVKGCVDIPSKNEKALENAVASVGPISVAIDAGHMSFQLYDSGVYYEPGCSETQLDHGVLAVGYGTVSNSRYWLVKNSWGPEWGENGYIRMTKDKNNNCGIATSSSYPTGVEGRK